MTSLGSRHQPGVDTRGQFHPPSRPRLAESKESPSNRIFGTHTVVIAPRAELWATTKKCEPKPRNFVVEMYVPRRRATGEQAEEFKQIVSTIVPGSAENELPGDWTDDVVQAYLESISTETVYVTVCDEL
jgi:hypothetical protein